MPVRAITGDISASLGEVGVADPSLSARSNGGYVIAWTTGTGSTVNNDVHVRAFSINGAILTQANLLVPPSDRSAEAQRTPAVTAIGNGGYVVAYEDQLGFSAADVNVRFVGFDIDGRRGLGGSTGPTPANVATQNLDAATATQSIQPDVATLRNGNLVFSWSQNQTVISNDRDVLVSIYDQNASRLTNESQDIVVSSSLAGEQTNSKVSALANGGFVVVWTDSGIDIGNPDPRNIKAQIFSANGLRVGSEILVSDTTFGDQNLPSVTGLANGGFVVSWMTNSGGHLGDASGFAIAARRFDSLGNPLGVELLVNSVLAFDQTSPSVSAFSNGAFVVTWKDNSASQGNFFGNIVKARLFSADGIPDGLEFQVGVSSSGNQISPDVGVLSGDAIAFTWNNSRILTRTFAADVSVLGAQLSIVTPSVLSVIENTISVATVVATGRVVANDLTFLITGGSDSALFSVDENSGVLQFRMAPNFERPVDTNNDNVYEVFVQASDGTAVTEKRFEIQVGDVSDNIVLFGTSRNNILSAVAGFDTTIIGLAGNDTLTGNDGYDILVGGQGNDSLVGGDGDDVFEIAVGDGIDRFIGGSGFDRIVATSDNAVIGLAVINSIEEITSSGFSNVSIVGTSSSEAIDFSAVSLSGIARIDGGAGNDTISGSHGPDIFVLGLGNDIFQGNEGDDVFLAGASNGTDFIGGGLGIDSIFVTQANVSISFRALSSIEVIDSTGFANTRLVGTSGADLIDSSNLMLVMVSEISGGGGADTIIGSSAADRISGGTGRDFLSGGAGEDVFSYAAVSESGVGSGRADFISDFQSGIDAIDLSRIDANASVAGNQEFVFILGSQFTGLGQVRISANADGSISLFANTTGNFNPDFEVKVDASSIIQSFDLIL